ncbi:MAG: beta-eliminating lyase-related protein, partial [Dorea sp.]|nr:beta-eliminating lyase-related protein [Dorea sp.]
APDVKAFIQNFYDDGNHEHMVYPGMVYISHPTENGTLYTRKELADLSAVCREYDIPLFLDGARLGYGLAAAKLENYETLPSLQEIAELADVFYIGGTKVGALIGEAVVFTKNNMPKRFVTQIKRRGALLAKGFLLGTMFDVLFTDDLYMKNGMNGIETARYLADGLRKLGCKFHMESPTNQQYLVLDNETMAKLSEKVGFSFWEKVDDTHTAIRFCTSWATTKEKVDELLAIMAELSS